jgi:glycosyltransferase involved in cell wall biosynthesis
MNILYIGPYVSSEYKLRNVEPNIGSLAASKKIDLMMDIFTKLGHKPIILSSINYHSSNYNFFKKTQTEILSKNEIDIKIIYPPGLRFKLIGGLLNCLMVKKIISKTIKNYRPDVIILYNSYLFEALVYRAIFKKFKTPLVLQIEDLPYARKRGKLNIKPFLDKLSFDKLLLKANQYLIVHENLRGLIPIGKPCLTLPGILDPALISQSKLRKPPFSSAKKILGYFGGLDESKGVGVLFRLIKNLPTDWIIFISGAGNLSEKFRDLELEYPEKLKFYGVIDSITLYSLMCQCDCVLVPPERIVSKGVSVFPFKIFEYIASGAMIICPKIDGLDALGLTFLTNWDGSDKSLLRVLMDSETLYLKLRLNYIASRNQIISRYTLEKHEVGFEAFLNKLVANA